MGCFTSNLAQTEAPVAPHLPRTPKPSRNPRGVRYIVIVGRTGSGISQFIHDATGRYAKGVASEGSLHPRTQKITPIKFQSARFGTIILIDTPGFDYSQGNDEYVRFNQLHKWFQSRYGRQTKLDGVIYMHNIWNAEAYHRSPLLTCQALEDLCGQDWRKKVSLVNSHWNERITGDGGEREERLRAGYWRFMLQKGSTMVKYESPGDRRRAQQILEDLLER